MRRQPFPGGWYGMAFPNGDYAVNIKGQGKVATHLGDKAHPWTDALYVFATQVPSFRICAQAWATGQDVEWRDGAWQVVREISHGVNPVAYDAAGKLHFNSGQAGSQGWRYIGPDGTLVTADATHDLWNGLNDRVEVAPGLWVGQANDDAIGGLLVWDGQVHRRLEEGHCTFPRLAKDGEQVTITVTKPGEVVALHTTVDELRTLPVVGTVEQPGGEEEPLEDMTQKQREALVLSVAMDVDESHPDLLKANTRESCGQFTELVARDLHLQDPKWGHVGKRPEQNNYNGHAVDAVMYDGPVEVYDIIIGAGDGMPTSVSADLTESGGQPWLDPDDIPGAEPPNDDDDVKPSCNLCQKIAAELEEELELAQQAITSLKANVAALLDRVDALEVGMDGIGDDIDTLAERPFPKQVRLTGSTSREWGHAHTFDLVGTLSE